jgi:hypothetical protein
MTATSALHARRYVSFPPKSGFLMLPDQPARAARAGLALYDTVQPRQRVMLRLGSALGRAGLQRLLPTNTRGDVDWGWWELLLAEVAEPLLGPVGHLALRIPPAPFSPCALLLDASGGPRAFVKADTPPPGEEEAAVCRLLDAADLTSFRVPRILATGALAGVVYRMLEPLPEGPHRDPPFDPTRLWRIIDEYRAVLADLPRPPGADPDLVPCHGDLHLRNLRVASDGGWWLFDWERFRWAPRLADELRYWSSEFGGRASRRVRDDGPRVLRLLRERGSDEEILAAVRWPDYQPKRPVQRAVYAAVERALLSGS